MTNEQQHRFIVSDGRISYRGYLLEWREEADAYEISDPAGNPVGTAEYLEDAADDIDGRLS